MKELVAIINESKADFVILGGDFNSDPVVNQNETTLKDIKSIMVSSVEEKFPKQEVQIFFKITYLVNVKEFATTHIY